MSFRFPSAAQAAGLAESALCQLAVRSMIVRWVTQSKYSFSPFSRLDEPIAPHGAIPFPCVTELRSGKYINQPLVAMQSTPPAFISKAARRWLTVIPCFSCPVVPNAGESLACFPVKSECQASGEKFVVALDRGMIDV